MRLLSWITVGCLVLAAHVERVGELDQFRAEPVEVFQNIGGVRFYHGGCR